MFQGFSDATIDFMYGIRINNEKPWFEAHKEEYLTHFYHPMKELADALYQRLDDNHPKYGFVHKVSRIYRDARRLRGRGPYKENLWLSIEKPSDQWTATPVFWFELTPAAWTYGLGYYNALPVTMARLRARMDANPAPMKKLTKFFASQDEFILQGTPYAKEKPAEHQDLSPWYQLKSFSLIHEEKNSAALYTPDLVERLAAGFEFLMPFYDYFITLDGDPDPRE